MCSITKIEAVENVIIIVIIGVIIVIVAIGIGSVLL